MIYFYQYPDGRESRHARYKIRLWGTSVNVFDVSLQYRVKRWWGGYRWYTVISVVYYPSGATSFAGTLTKLREMAETERENRRYWKYLK